MRHNKTVRRLGRNKSQRKSLVRNLALSFFQNKKICTTDARAKALKRVVERLITAGKQQDLASIRRINAFLNNPAATKIVKDLGMRYRDRNGGYTRITRAEKRKGDAGDTAIIQLVS